MRCNDITLKADAQDEGSGASAFVVCLGLSWLMVTLYEFYMGNIASISED